MRLSLGLARRLLASLVLALPLAGLALAQAPPGYYDSVDTASGAALRQTVHQAIRDHQRFPYTSTATDTWLILGLAEEDPADPGRILDLYRNESYPRQGDGVGPYNREHVWPNSYGFPQNVASNYPYTDCHALFLCDASYNNSRGNKPFRFGAPTHTERPTVLNNGQGGGTGTYPGNSNWTAGQSTSGGWEVWIGRRGDVARALLYLDVRYEGGFHGVTGAAEPDLVLTDDEVLIAASNTGSNESVAYMGLRSVLLAWHHEDPVDDFERARHEVVFGFQGNRNPFIDHPEWVDCIFADLCEVGLGTAFCAGDGSAASCPCGATGEPGHGCPNAAGPSGASLAASGSLSIAASDCVLTVTGSIPGQPGMLFQGFDAVAGGQGQPFGDGLFCVQGGVIRLQALFANGAGEAVSTVDLGAPGLVLPGGTRRYQWWYRDPVGAPCGGSGFNLSNGLELTWMP